MSTDLRVVKTEKSIREAFISLRAQKPTEKISVKELCEAAMINKATFYLHYKDIYELSDILENNLIEDCLATIADEEAPSVDKMVFDLAKAFSSQSKLFHILFSDGDADKLAGMVNDFVSKRADIMFPHISKDLGFNIRLRATIYGGFHSFFAYKDCDRHTLISHIADFAKHSMMQNEN